MQNRGAPKAARAVRQGLTDGNLREGFSGEFCQEAPRRQNRESRAAWRVCNEIWSVNLFGAKSAGRPMQRTGTSKSACGERSGLIKDS